MQRSTEDFLCTRYSLNNEQQCSEDGYVDCSLRDSINSSININSGTYEVLSSKLLKRKPSKAGLKLSKNVELQSDYTNSFKFKLINGIVSSKEQCLNVDTQLNRLQKTLVSSKSGKKLHTGSRSTRLLKKMIVEKQNMSLGVDRYEVTSQQLHSFHEQDEEIKQILLALVRFEEQQKLKNDRLEQQIKEITSRIERQKQALEVQNQKLVDFKEYVMHETKKMRQEEYAILRSKVNDQKYY